VGLTRRQFLKWAGVTSVGAVVFNGCRVPDHEIQIQSPVELPEDLVTGRDNFYATAAPFGAASEGLLVRVMEGRAKKVEGNPDYPMNTGKHGLRAESLLQAAYHPDRITGPLARRGKGGAFERISWEDAINRLTSLLGEAEAGSVLLAVNPARGELASMINRFAAGSGAAVAGFDPADQTVLRAAVKRVFGQDALPTFDLAHAGHVLSFGADILGTWVDPTHFSRGYGEMRQGGHARGTLTVVDSRFSLTAAAADQWVYAKPGTEGLLALSIAQVIIDEGLGDAAASSRLTGGRGAGALAAYRPSVVANEIGISAEQIVSIAHEFADKTHGQAVAIGGGSAGAHTNGLFNLTAIYALNYLVGAVNREGGVLFNPATRVERIGAAPLRAWKGHLADMRSGKVKVLLVRDANIVYGLPKGLNAAGAVGAVETVVSFSSFLDETTALADLILPGSTPLEEWGTDTPDPGPGFETVAFQQPVIRPYRNTLAFGDVLLKTGAQLGIAGLPASMQDAVKLTAQALHATGTGSVTRPTFSEFWKRALERGGWWNDRARGTGSGSAPALPTAPQRAALGGDANDYPFYLVPFEGHGVGAGEMAHLPWAQNAPDPITTATWTTWVELNPKTAKAMNLAQDDVVVVEAPNGRTIEAPVYVHPAVPPEVAAIPMGQGHTQFTSYAAGRGVNVLDILDPVEDEETGALAWAATRVRLVKTRVRQRVPKLEGLTTPYQLPHEEIILVQRSGSGQSH
jgi:anaerobic selenocysteine-containing dehydrogenase